MQRSQHSGRIRSELWMLMPCLLVLTSHHHLLYWWLCMINRSVSVQIWWKIHIAVIWQLVISTLHFYNATPVVVSYTNICKITYHNLDKSKSNCSSKFQLWWKVALFQLWEMLRNHHSLSDIEACIKWWPFFQRKSSGTCFIVWMDFPGTTIPIIKIRLSWDNLICIIRIPIMVWQHLSIETTGRHLNEVLLYMIYKASYHLL